MSHIVEIETEVRDAQAVSLACQRLNLTVPTHGTTKVFAQELTGLMVSLPDWLYPIVIDTDSGQVQYDNYHGRWGDRLQLDRFLQGYAVEKVKLESRRNGYLVTEETLRDGSVRLSVQTGAAA